MDTDSRIRRDTDLRRLLIIEVDVELISQQLRHILEQTIDTTFCICFAERDMDILCRITDCTRQRKVLTLYNSRFEVVLTVCVEFSIRFVLVRIFCIEVVSIQN